MYYHLQLFTSGFANIFLIFLLLVAFWLKIMGCNTSCTILKLQKILFCKILDFSFQNITLIDWKRN